jgi:hypothetical protein
MALPKDVQEADEALVIDGAPVIWKHYPAVRAHLMSQEAEIARLRAVVVRNAAMTESRLATADALLREVYDHGENMALHEKIAAHLSENTHDRA